MKRERLQELLATSFEEAVKAVSVKPKPKTEEPLKEYNVSDHSVFDTGKRPNIPRVKKNAEGKVIETLPDREVNRIGIPFEKIIVGRAAAFLCANPVQYKAVPANDKEKKLFAAFKKVNERSKLDFKNQSILETRMSEMEVAEIWYLEDTEKEDDYWNGTDVKGKRKPRLFLSCSSLLDKLWPVWDDQDNLIAFGREYVVKTEDGKDETHFDLYTAEKIYEGKKNATGWEVTEQANDVGKIVVVYHHQNDVEWADVKTENRRLETIMSNLGDSNDKTNSPILFVEGDIHSLPEGTTGRVIRGKSGAKMSYVAHDNAPASQKLEIETLEKYIYSMTDTPDISLDNLKGMGAVAGVALEFMFMGAHLKASKHAGTFGECIQRRINLILRMIVTIDPSLKAGMTIQITPHFDLFLPKDVGGIITYLKAATGDGKLLSQESAVNILQSAMGGDGTEELDKIKKEKSETPEPIEGGGNSLTGDSLGKIPLALQQLTLASVRAEQNGDTVLADRLNKKVDELLKTI